VILKLFIYISQFSSVLYWVLFASEASFATSSYRIKPAPKVSGICMLINSYSPLLSFHRRKHKTFK